MMSGFRKIEWGLLFGTVGFAILVLALLYTRTNRFLEAPACGVNRVTTAVGEINQILDQLTDVDQVSDSRAGLDSIRDVGDKLVCLALPACMEEYRIDLIQYLGYLRMGSQLEWLLPDQTVLQRLEYLRRQADAQADRAQQELERVLACMPDCESSQDLIPDHSQSWRCDQP